MPYYDLFGTESPYPNLPCKLPLSVLLLCSMTHYDIITIGNDIVLDIHCDVTMCNDVATCTYDITMHNGIAVSLSYYVSLHPIIMYHYTQLLCITTPNYYGSLHPIMYHYTQLLWITTPNYYIAVIPVNSLKLYINIKINIKSIVVWHKNKNKFGVTICENHVHCFLVGIFHSSCRLMQYPYTKTIQMLSTE